MRKPDNITYWTHDHPPLPIAAAMALQQLSFLAVYLVVSPFFARTLKLDLQQSLQLISATLLASGFGVILQTFRRGPIGSGLFCPLQATSSTFGALTLAKSIGGIGAVFGAVGMLGLVQIFFSYVFSQFRGVFNLQVAGVAVLLIGLGLGHNGLTLILHPNIGHLSTTGAWLACVATLGTMIIANVWFKGFVHLFSAFIGLTAGFFAVLWLADIPDSTRALLKDAPWFYLPAVGSGPLTFDIKTLPAIALTGLFLALHAFGGLVAAQRFNDADWKRPEMNQIRRGIVAEGVTNLVSALLHGLPITSSGGAVTMAAATGCTSRYIAYWLGGLMALIAFMPKVILFWTLLPDVLLGSAMIFLSCFTLMAGLQIITSRLLDNRKILAIGLGILLGISFESQRSSFVDQLPEWLAPYLFSGVGIGIFTTLALTILFRMGSTSRERRKFDACHTSLAMLSDFLEHQGKSWGAAKELVQRSIYATWQVFELLTQYELFLVTGDGQEVVEVETIANEFNFSVLIRYRGLSVPLAMNPPTAEQLIEDDLAVLQMAGYMIRQLADEVYTEFSTERPFEGDSGLDLSRNPDSETNSKPQNAELRLVFNL
jgi:NCS2 family nucleobase:cation symporter-2